MWQWNFWGISNHLKASNSSIWWKKTQTHRSEIHLTLTRISNGLTQISEIEEIQYNTVWAWNIRKLKQELLRKSKKIGWKVELYIPDTKVGILHEMITKAPNIIMPEIMSHRNNLHSKIKDNYEIWIEFDLALSMEHSKDPKYIDNLQNLYENLRETPVVKSEKNVIIGDLYNCLRNNLLVFDNEKIELNFADKKKLNENIKRYLRKRHNVNVGLKSIDNYLARARKYWSTEPNTSTTSPSSKN